MKSHFNSALWLGVMISGLRAFQAGAGQAYTLDPGTGPYEFLGTGTFELVLNESLGAYQATAVSGGGKTFGTWQAVEFRAFGGQFASLVISNLALVSIELSLPGIGGGEIMNTSTAILEWDHFTGAISNTLGIRIASAPVSGVPDQGPLLPVAAAALGCTVLLAKRCQSKKRTGTPSA